MTDLSNHIFRTLQYLRHHLCATNTLGHGIHSPSVFELVRMIIYDNNAYYCFEQIERQRDLLLKDNHEIYVEDMGTGRSGRRRTSDIAAQSLESRDVAQMLMRIVCHRKAKNIVELGTCLGITTAYLASADSQSCVTTFEGSGELAASARKVWERLNLKNINLIEGNIDKTLPLFADDCSKSGRAIDFAFVDANHAYEPTLRYFKQTASLCHKDSIVVIDDLYYSPEMLRAWKNIQLLPEVTACIDCYKCGIVMFNPQLEKRCYRIRI